MPYEALPPMKGFCVSRAGFGGRRGRWVSLELCSSPLKTFHHGAPPRAVGSCSSSPPLPPHPCCCCHSPSCSKCSSTRPNSICPAVLSGSVRPCSLLTLDPFLLLVATSITIALLPLGISLRVHVTESGGLHARRTHTDLAPHVLVDQALSAAQLLMPLLSGCCGCSSGPLPCEKSHDAKAPRSPIRKTACVAPPRVVTADCAWGRETGESGEP